MNLKKTCSFYSFLIAYGLHTSIQFSEMGLVEKKLCKTRILRHFAPIFYFNCEHFLIITLKKKKQNFHGFYKEILRRITNFYKNNLKTFGGVTRDPTKNLGSIGTAVLTFIWFKQTDRHAKFRHLDIQIKFTNRNHNFELKELYICAKLYVLDIK